jgi:hypothetical protein
MLFLLILVTLLQVTQVVNRLIYILRVILCYSIFFTFQIVFFLCFITNGNKDVK